MKKKFDIFSENSKKKFLPQKKRRHGEAGNSRIFCRKIRHDLLLVVDIIHLDEKFNLLQLWFWILFFSFWKFKLGALQIPPCFREEEHVFWRFPPRVRYPPLSLPLVFSKKILGKGGYLEWNSLILIIVLINYKPNYFYFKDVWYFNGGKYVIFYSINVIEL